MTALGASAIKSRSFHTRFSRGNQAFSYSSLDDQPDSYAVMLQFADGAAAQRAKIIYDNWVNRLRKQNNLADGGPAQAEVAEITYPQGDSSDQDAYFESVGLTVWSIG